MDGRENRDAAWCCADPLPAAEPIRGGSGDASRELSLLGRIAAMFRC
ncbi:hypothetical protein [Streptomyces canus]